MVTTTTTARADDIDLLQHLAIQMPCGTCGRHYPVTLRQVLLSQITVHAGCSIDGDCPPLTYAALANEAALRDLERDWSRVLQSVRALGLELAVSRPMLSH
ncbi:MAG TPA: hypothetical protein VG871_16665 [Vicinamibacterales bacterium]|nr:hypothetical protein [Vicinamibacterales bacterium]